MAPNFAAAGLPSSYSGDIHITISGASGPNQDFMGVATIAVLAMLMILGLVCFIIGSFVLPVIMSITAMQQHLEEERGLEEQAEEHRYGKTGHGKKCRCKTSKMDDDNIL